MRPTCLFIASSSVLETWCGSTQALFTGFRPSAGATTLHGMSDHSQVRKGDANYGAACTSCSTLSASRFRQVPLYESEEEKPHLDKH